MQPALRQALIYVRISQDREGAGLGVARQEQDCRALVESLGWDVREVYVDNDISASSGRSRPAYGRLLEDLRGARGDAVVAWHPDRLHRSPRELETFIDAVESSRAAVATVRAGSLDLATPAGRAVARTLGAWARYEVEAKADRQRRKSDELAAAGAFSGGGRPFGFEPDGVTVRESEAEVLRWATSAVLGGASLGSVAKELNARGVLTSVGKRWDYPQLRFLLVRPRNAGLRQHRGEVVGPAAWPALVPEEQWRGVVDLLADPARRKSLDNRVRWLGAGLFHCGVCGDRCRSATATSRASKEGRATTHTIYRCRSHGLGGQRHVARRAQPVDDYVVAVIVGRLSQPDAYELFARRDDDTAVDVGVQLAQARARLQAVAVEFADGVLEPDQVKIITNRLRARIAELEDTLPTAPSPLIAQVASAGQEAAAAWEALTVRARRELLQSLCRVTLLPKRAHAPRTFDPESVRIDWV